LERHNGIVAHVKAEKRRGVIQERHSLQQISGDVAVKDYEMQAKRRLEVAIITKVNEGKNGRKIVRNSGRQTRFEAQPVPQTHR
jgi:hypothetical protein